MQTLTNSNINPDPNPMTIRCRPLQRPMRPLRCMRGRASKVRILLAHRRVWFVKCKAPFNLPSKHFVLMLWLLCGVCVREVFYRAKISQDVYPILKPINRDTRRVLMQPYKIYIIVHRSSVYKNEHSPLHRESRNRCDLTIPSQAIP